MHDYTKLRVWRRAHAVTLTIYQESRCFPPDETYNLRLQIRRAASGVGSTISEGAGRSSDRDFARFLDMAAASASEVDYQILLARDLGYWPPELADPLRRETGEIRRMLGALIDRLRKSPRRKKRRRERNAPSSDDATES